MPTHNLPSQPTPFVGREQELAQIARLLFTPACRLLTLVGPGGIGKTRLALEGARRIADRDLGFLDGPEPPAFADGVYFLGMGPGGSYESLILALARTLSCPLYGKKNSSQQVLDNLRDKRLLLVLDSFEFHLALIPLLGDIVDAAPHVKLLVTSRQRLLLQGEWTLEVVGLTVPVNVDAGSLENSSAASLFLQTARRYGADISSLEAHPLLRICRLVEGMPLALELAAAWTRALSCHQIAAEIERGLDILATETTIGPEKHRSMRIVFEQSWQLLTDDERAVFQKLSEFRGGFTLAAARQVAGASIWILSALVDKSMLSVDSAGRFAIHDLLRQYADETVAEREGVKAETRDRHAVYYAEFLHDLGEKLKGPGQIEALDAIEADYENVREAWRWAAMRRNASAMDQSVRALALYFQMRARSREGAELLGFAVEQWDRSENPLLGYLLLLQGWFFDGSRDQVLFRRGVELLRSSDFPGNLPVLFTMLFFYAHHLGGYTEVRRVYREKLEWARLHNDLWVEAWTLSALGLVSYALNEIDDAWECERESLEAFRSLGDSWGSVWALNTLAGWYDDRGDAELAAATFRESLAICRVVGDIGGINFTVGNLAAISGKWEESGEFRQSMHRLLQKRTVNWVDDIGQFCQIARWLEVQSGPELALQIVAHFRNHPHVPERIVSSMDEWIAKFRTRLPEVAFVAAVQQGRISSSETMLQALASTLADLESRAAKSTPVPDKTNPLASDTVSVDSLGEREVQVITLVAQGLSSPEIADRLDLSVHTVRWYLKQVYAKLDVHNRTEAAVRARELGLLSADKSPH